MGESKFRVPVVPCWLLFPNKITWHLLDYWFQAIRPTASTWSFQTSFTWPSSAVSTTEVVVRGCANLVGLSPHQRATATGGKTSCKGRSSPPRAPPTVLSSRSTSLSKIDREAPWLTILLGFITPAILYSTSPQSRRKPLCLGWSRRRSSKGKASCWRSWRATRTAAKERIPVTDRGCTTTAKRPRTTPSACSATRAWSAKLQCSTSAMNAARAPDLTLARNRRLPLRKSFTFRLIWARRRWKKQPTRCFRPPITTTATQRWPWAPNNRSGPRRKLGCLNGAPSRSSRLMQSTRSRARWENCIDVPLYFSLYHFWLSSFVFMETKHFHKIINSLLQTHLPCRLSENPDNDMSRFQENPWERVFVVRVVVCITRNKSLNTESQIKVKLR